jgi:molecular chaperone HtpG
MKMANKFEIPPRLEEILEENDTFSGFVKSSLGEFSPWLGQNNIKFFTEYTDHSLKHVEAVLETADDLIREKCRGIISAGDVATLVLATLLHDCAMHLSEDGFATLIKSDHVIPGFNDKPWSKLWEDFIAESRRFSGRKLMALFGDSKAIKPPPSDPNDLDAHEMTGKDLLLTGEFLRLHHHRLAHEIALYGVPGPKGNELKLPVKEETKHIVDLAGVVARSHGLPIRSCHDYLKDKYSNVRSFKRVHPVFLMALLRIGDILQLQSERAPQQVEKVRKLRSPVSQGEWEMHQAIKDINWTVYPETIFIHAEPPNAKTYLRIKRLLSQIQHELDSSWTVMSEAYYAEESLRELGLKIRRIRSNLDEKEEFAKKVDYIPCQASFEVADTDLLKLLIGPLYGERPEIGIRELMQNSIDAVREVREYRKKHPELKNVEFTKQDAEVVVSIDEEKDGWWVTVSDQGIGMTLDTVRNYFLKAGASLRRSEIWRKTFEDEEGKSQVLRSGRFGVGMLAAFLLGNEIEVSTRHISLAEDNGIAFSAELDAEAIELRRIKRLVGTTIRVRINSEVKDKLLGKWDEKEGKWGNQYKWDWYCLTDPKILLMTDHGSKKLHQKFQLPPLNEKLPPGWHRIKHPDYQDIHWTYTEKSGLTCNGIKIMETEDDELWEGEFFYIYSPCLSVFDFDANLPLNLQRTGLTQLKYPFHEELLIDISKDFISFVFVNSPTQPNLNISTLQWLSEFNYRGITIPFLSSYYSYPWFSTNFGISIHDNWHLSQIKARYLLLVPSYLTEYCVGDIFTPKIIPTTSQAVFFYSKERGYSKIEQAKFFGQVIEKSIGIEEYPFEQKVAIDYFTVPGYRSLISHHILKYIAEVSKFEGEDFLQGVVSEITEEWKNENWVLWRKGECPPPGFDFEKFAAENDGKNYDEWPCVLAEWYFKDPKPQLKESELSPLAKVWKEVVGSPIIPFHLEERRKMKVYKELKPYIEAHEKMKDSG